MEMKEKVSEKGKHNLLKTVLHFLFLKLDRYSKKKRAGGKMWQEVNEKSSNKSLCISYLLI